MVHHHVTCKLFVLIIKYMFLCGFVYTCKGIITDFRFLIANCMGAFKTINNWILFPYISHTSSTPSVARPCTYGASLCSKSSRKLGFRELSQELPSTRPCLLNMLQIHKCFMKILHTWTLSKANQCLCKRIHINFWVAFPQFPPLTH